MYGGYGSAARGSSGWVALILIVLTGFLLAGVMLGNSELLNPSAARERDAKTQIMLDEHQYEEQRRAIELEALRAEREAELAQMRETQARRAALLQDVEPILLGVGVGLILVLVGSGSFWMVGMGMNAVRAARRAAEDGAPKSETLIHRFRHPARSDGDGSKESEESPQATRSEARK